MRLQQGMQKPWLGHSVQVGTGDSMRMHNLSGERQKMRVETSFRPPSSLLCRSFWKDVWFGEVVSDGREGWGRCLRPASSFVQPASSMLSAELSLRTLWTLLVALELELYCLMHPTGQGPLQGQGSRLLQFT